MIEYERTVREVDGKVTTDPAVYVMELVADRLAPLGTIAMVNAETKERVFVGSLSDAAADFTPDPRAEHDEMVKIEPTDGHVIASPNGTRFMITITDTGEIVVIPVEA